MVIRIKRWKERIGEDRRGERRKSSYNGGPQNLI